jgi:hypothetical protein
MHGVSSLDPAFIPCTVAEETGLWHWLHNVLMFGIFKSRAFGEPCGVWQPTQPSVLTAACSKTNGPRVSVWQRVQMAF